MAQTGEATAADGPPHAATATGRPLPPTEGEVILWEGQPDSRVRRLLEMLSWLVLLLLLTWLVIELIRPHFGGSHFAGQPEADALPLILAMVVGTVSIIALPVWLRSSARARAHYMLTNRRALVWLGSRIVAEARLFGAELELTDGSLYFTAPGLFLSWRLKDEGPDRLRFERIADAETVAAMAEDHGARWLNRPDASEAASG